MNKVQAIQFLAQVAQDFLAKLDQSVRPGFQRDAQEAINVLMKPDEPPTSANEQKP